MKKETFVTKSQLEEIVKEYPTPFHLYDEKGIRRNIKALKEAFSWNKGYKEYFAVKATPNPFLINILREYGCGCDCSSYTELMLSEAVGAAGEDIMFSSNDTTAEEFAYADRLGAIINLDDITHIEYLEQVIGHIPETISCRYNPGGLYPPGQQLQQRPPLRQRLGPAQRLIRDDQGDHPGAAQLVPTADSRVAVAVCSRSATTLWTTRETRSTA